MMLTLAILSFALSSSTLAAYIDDGVSYDDLKRLNVTCDPSDTCAKREPDLHPGFDPPNSCSCHAQCSTRGTCCVDSPHRRKSPPEQTCGWVDYPQTYRKSNGYYMVQSCTGYSPWRHMCEVGSEEDGDVLKRAPVSSLDTHTTYRNYYCFRCRETTDHFLYWNLVLLSGTSDPIPDDFNLTYSDDAWSATSVTEGSSVDVRLQFEPPGMRLQVVKCNPQVVSSCPDSWEDDVTRSQCDSYTALLYDPFGTVYRNAHCALCHSQPLHELSCKEPKQITFVVKVFSFSHLIDISRSDWQAEAKKCATGEMWDPYAKKCRKLSCALPGHVIKEDKCVSI